MASGEILRADASALDAAGGEFNSCGEQTRDAMTRMRNQVSSLNGSFEGSAAQSFFSRMEYLFQQMQVLSDEIVEQGNDLKSMAARVRELNAQGATLLGD